MAKNNAIIYIIIGIIAIALIGNQAGLFTFFFNVIPSANLIPNEINEGDSAKVKFSSGLSEQGPISGAYFSSTFVNQKNICLNTAGTSNSDLFEFECLIPKEKYIPGINKVEIFQGYESSSGGARIPNGCFQTYEGAIAYDNYKSGRDGGKLFSQCLWGTPNGETYERNDQRWYDYPQGSEFERLCNFQPPGSGGGDSAGVRYATCGTYMSISNYERKSLSLNVIPKPECISGEERFNACSNGIQYLDKKCVNNKWQSVTYTIDQCLAANNTQIITINNTIYIIQNQSQTIKLSSCNSDSECGTDAICRNPGQQNSYCLLTQKDAFIKDFDISQLTEPPLVYYLLSGGFLIMLLWFTRR